MLPFQLNFDTDDYFHYYDDELTGPLRPGNAFYQWLGRGNIPLHVPMPETLIVGYPPYHNVGNGDGPAIPRGVVGVSGQPTGANGTTTAPIDPMTSIPSNVKLLAFDYKKNYLQSFYGHFDSQDLRDKFYELCYEKFLVPNSLNHVLKVKEENDIQSRRRAKIKKIVEENKPQSQQQVGSSGGISRTVSAADGEVETDGEGRGKESESKAKSGAVKSRPSSASALGRSRTKSKPVSEEVATTTTDSRAATPTTNQQPFDHKPVDVMEVAPLFNRFVAIQKRPVTTKPGAASAGGAVPTKTRKYSRGDTHQQCETVLSFAFQTHLLELFDSSINSEEKVASPFILQRWVKSRGKRPSVYRIFWKNGSDMGMAEGYNIAKSTDEFVFPDLAMRNNQKTIQPNSESAKSSGGVTKGKEVDHADDHHGGEGDEEFQKLTTKFVANILLLGKKKSQENSASENHATRASNPSGIQQTTVGNTEMKTKPTTSLQRPKSAGATPTSRGIKKLTRFDTAISTDQSVGEEKNNGTPTKGPLRRSFVSSSSNSLPVENAASNGANNPDAVTDVGKTTEQTKTKILDSLFSKSSQELDE